jgi:N-acetylmuramoyl-L-alanine amidase
MDFMLDAGHDQYTSGKGVPTMKEFEFNRAVVLKVQGLLKQYENVNAHLSHDLFDGIDTSLKARTDLANRLKVKAFISFHADAFSNASAKGETVFIYTKTGNSTLALANAINTELKADMSISNRGVKRADFHVLRETNMDAVLIEFGFMTNAADLALLKSDTYRTKCAEMVVKALEKHYGLKKKVVAPQPTPVSKPTTVIQPTPVKTSPQGIGTLKVIENTVIRDRAVYLGNITGNVKSGEEYIVHDYQNGWFNIGGWVSAKYVQFNPYADTKITK